MALAPDIEGFSRLITALDPWLDRVVIVGGWAHRLYHLHPAAQKLDFAPLMTVVLANPEVADNLGVALHPSIPLFASVGGAGGGFLGFLSPATGASA